jgi:IclR family transcriptional regulator, pca regulon regulatory protein
MTHSEPSPSFGPPPSLAELEAAHDPNIMTSLARGLVVIQAFSREQPALTISEISQKTGIPRAAVRRCLYTLHRLGFADTDGRAYTLLPRILSLGYAYLNALPFAQAAQSVLRRISDTIHESSSIAILDGDDIVYIARAQVSRIMTIDLSVGSRLPAAFTSMGRVLMAWRAEELEARLARIVFKPYTANTLRDAAGLRREIAAVRQAGYSLLDQELELGLRSIAVPIFAAPGRVVASLNVGAHASRITPQEMVGRILPILQEAAGQLSFIAD